MRVRDMRTNEKLIVDYLDLIPMNEMEVIAYQLADDPIEPEVPIKEPKPVVVKQRRPDIIEILFGDD